MSQCVISEGKCFLVLTGLHRYLSVSVSGGRRLERRRLAAGPRSNGHIRSGNRETHAMAGADEGPGLADGYIPASGEHVGAGALDEPSAAVFVYISAAQSDIVTHVRDGGDGGDQIKDDGHTVPDPQLHAAAVRKPESQSHQDSVSYRIHE